MDDLNALTAGQTEWEKADVPAATGNEKLQDRSYSSPEILITNSSAQSSELSTEPHRKGSADPLGLVVVWIPLEPIVDIIFIHGLGGSARRSWSWEHNPDFFWPSWLCSDPQLARARVHTFGYAAGISGPSSAMNIHDFAKDFLFKMKHAFVQGSVIGSVSHDSDSQHQF